MKRCFRCGLVRALEEFYRHPQMADGRLNKCKDCTKADVTRNYQERKPHYVAYERERNTRPERKAAKAEYQREHRARHPEHSRARATVGYHVRAGHLVRQPCEKCGSPKSEAHHPDHSKPLDVQWLCLVHHREADRKHA